MDVYQGSFISAADMEEQAEMMTDVKKGPWTADEDAMLMNYVTIHGEGRWNSVARFAGLKRTGKSCRLRWLNYLRPDLRRGNMTLQEQLLILELHSRWGNRWSKIAQYMPGRTDNEIKNYWRTRVQKQAKQLKCDVNSKQFRDTMQYVWMPRLREQIQSSTSNTSSFSQSAATTNPDAVAMANPVYNHQTVQMTQPGYEIFEPSGFMPEMSACTSDDSSLTHVTPVSDLSECYDCQWSETRSDNGSASCTESFAGNPGWGFPVQEQNECNPWVGGGGGGDGDNLMMMVDNWWNEENIFFLQQQLSDDCF